MNCRTTMANDQLQLRYDFFPTPNPIRASQQGANPETVDVQVMVSNSGAYVVTLRTLSITIPVGAEVAGTLSNAVSLPQPVYDTAIPWTITAAGSAVTIVPAQGTDGSLGGTIVFTLPGIAVNETPGMVPITITELFAAGGTGTDGRSYTLVKQPADFPVTSFRAEPPVLYDVDVPVTLYWTCSDAGKSYVYSVHSSEWQPCDCLQAGTCLTWEDGAKGVQTPRLAGFTRFSLDVIGTDASGHRTVHATLQTAVEVSVPSISPNSYLAPYLSGYVVRLHWLAQKSSRCTVMVDGVSIDERAPVDTYQAGYLVPLSPGSAPHQLAVVAHAATGSTTASLVFPEVSIRPPSVIPGFNSPSGVAVTPDGTLGLVTTLDGVSLLDMASLQVVGRVDVGAGAFPSAVAVTSDGKLALVLNQGSNDVTVVDLETRSAEPAHIPVGHFPYDIALSADGTIAITANDVDATLIDVAGRRAEATIPLSDVGPRAVAITPDGTVALLPGIQQCVGVIDVVARRRESATIPTTGRFSEGIAIPPSGSRALVGMIEYGTDLMIVDVPGRRSAGSISGTPGTSRLTVSPDGTLVLASSSYLNSARLIEVATGRVLASPELGMPVSAVAFTPDGVRALLTSPQDGMVIVL